MDHVKLNIPDNLFNKSLSELIDQAYLTACENIDKHPAFADIKVLLGQAFKFVDNKNTPPTQVYIVQTRDTGTYIAAYSTLEKGYEGIKRLKEEHGDRDLVQELVTLDDPSLYTKAEKI